MKYFDQHVHCNFSYDSKESIENYIIRAKELGFDTLEFTDHYDTDIDHYDNWRTDFKSENKEIEKYRKLYPDINIFQGIEIGFSPDKLEEIISITKNFNFNVINLSMHESDGIDFYFVEHFLSRGVDNSMNVYFSSLINAIESFDNFDVLSHIDYAFKTTKKINPNASISDYEKYLIIIMKTLIKKNKGLEINKKVQEAINDDEHLKYLLCLYKSLGGIYLTLSSDAHEKKYLGTGLKLHYLNIFKECGFNELTFFINRKPILVSIDDIIANQIINN